MELKPCPFCGENEQEVERDIQDGFEADYYVRCGYCDARSGRCGKLESAQSEWNKRASDKTVVSNLLKCNSPLD